MLAREQLQPYAQPLLSKAGEWFPSMGPSKRRLEGLITDQVKRGPFRITVTERGTLDSLKNAVLASKVEGSTTIISIVPEGTAVKAGDLVCELDASALVEKETQQQISVTQAKSNLQSAMEAVEIQKTQNDSDIAAAMLKLELAKLDLVKFNEGDSRQQREELASQVTLSQEKVAQADETYDFTMRLVKKGYKTQNELESARITLQTERINLNIAKGKLDLLEKYDQKRTLTELEANASEFARELDRVKRKASAALAQAEADLAAKRLTHDVELSKHNRLKDQIALCKIYAPQDGQVIYANSRDGRSDQVLVEEGASVRERQSIVNLPDLTEMKVNARIHESRISMIRAGLAVNVRVDAFSEQPFPGRVESVSSVPSSTGNFMTRDLKEYEAIVRILGNGSEVSKLRPGLTAEIEVQVSSRENILQAPIQSILTVVNQQVAFVVSGDKAEMRKVTIGQTNDRMIEIVDGLNEGEAVVMNARAHFDKEIKDLETTLIAEQAAKAATESSKTPNLSPAELQRQPSLSPPGQAPFGHPGAGAPGQQRPPGSPGGPEGMNRDPLARFNGMDANKDGKLARDEWSERFATFAESMDADKDGSISLDEFKAASSRMGGRPPGAGPEQQPGGG